MQTGAGVAYPNWRLTSCQKEIQQNFERKRKAKEANIALDNNINWTVAVDSLAQEINRTTNIDKKNALLIKFEQNLRNALSTQANLNVTR